MANAVSEVGVVVPDRVPEKSSRSATSWGAVVAGAVAAAAATVVLMLVGAGLGLTVVSPFSNAGHLACNGDGWDGGLADCRAVAVGPARRLHGRPAAHQMGQPAHGRSLLPRHRARLPRLGAGDIARRRTAELDHLGDDRHRRSGCLQRRQRCRHGRSRGGRIRRQQHDGLFRRHAAAARRSGDPVQGGEQASAEVARILLASAASGEMAADDRAYLEKLVAARTGLSPADATARVDAVLKRADEAAQQAKQAAETARKAGVTFALVGALSLFIGAFIASAAAALGGRLRDDNEGALDLRS